MVTKRLLVLIAIAVWPTTHLRSGQAPTTKRGRLGAFASKADGRQRAPDNMEDVWAERLRSRV